MPQGYRSHFDINTVKTLVDKLVYLNQNTDPQFVEAAVGKARRARVALGYARALFETVAGWAIDHEVGAAIAKAKHKEISLDDHKHETGPNDLSDANIKRAVIARLAMVMPLPRLLGVELSRALTALDFGEVMPLLARSAGGLHGNAYTIAHLRLTALRHVEYRRGVGLKKEAALADVAQAYGQAANTVKGWERTVSESLGKDLVAAHRESARFQAKERVRLRAAKDAHVEIKLLEDDYGDAALQTDGAAYRAAQKNAPD
jgi:hypothetical protein